MKRTCVSMPPSVTSWSAGSCFSCSTVWRGEAAQLLLVLRQRVAGEVEVEDLLLVFQLFRLRPLRHVGQRLGRRSPRRRPRRRRTASNRLRWPWRRSSCSSPADWMRARQDVQQLAPVAAEAVERAGLDQLLDGRLVDAP